MREPFKQVSHMDMMKDIRSASAERRRMRDSEIRRQEIREEVIKLLPKINASFARIPQGKEASVSPEVETPSVDLLTLIKAHEYTDPEGVNEGYLSSGFTDHFNNVIGADLDGKTRTKDLVMPDKKFIERHEDPEIRERGLKLDTARLAQSRRAMRSLSQVAKDVDAARKMTLNQLVRAGISGDATLDFVKNGLALRLIDPMTQH